jgi:hypothetical protein
MDVRDDFGLEMTAECGGDGRHLVLAENCSAAAARLLYGR